MYLKTELFTKKITKMKNNSDKIMIKDDFVNEMYNCAIKN